MSIQLPGIEAVESLTVHGLGTMGRTWVLAVLLAEAKFKVFAHEPEGQVRISAVEFIKTTLGKIEAKKGPPGLAEQAMKRLQVVDAATALTSTTPIHLEVIPEDLALKQRFFQELGPRVLEGTVLWTNTSCLSVGSIARASGRPEYVVGTHGMNPVHLMPAVEVVRTDLVDSEVFSWTMEVLKKMGKTPFAAKDVPGFIVNKLYVALALETIRLLFRKEADIETIDLALKLSLGHPQGGLLLADRIGHDVMIDVADALYTATQDPRFAVPPEYRAMREAGYLGFKSGHGFYDWSDPKNPTPIDLDEVTAIPL